MTPKPNPKAAHAPTGMSRLALPDKRADAPERAHVAAAGRHGAEGRGEQRERGERGAGGTPTPLEPADADDDLDADTDSAEDKRLKRMRRNRESAAMSRHRKKQYVEDLEAQVAFLKESRPRSSPRTATSRRECAHAREPSAARSRRRARPPPGAPCAPTIGLSTRALLSMCRSDRRCPTWGCSRTWTRRPSSTPHPSDPSAFT